MLDKDIKEYGLGKEEEEFLKSKKRGYGCNLKHTLYLCLMIGPLLYEFVQNRMLSNRVSELQGKVDNLYQEINKSKKDNEVLNKK